MLPPERLNAYVSIRFGLICRGRSLVAAGGGLDHSWLCIVSLEKVVVLMVPIVGRLKRGKRTGTVCGWELELNPR